MGHYIKGVRGKTSARCNCSPTRNCWASDAIVTTVQGSILEQAGTGNDLLDKIPGLSAEEGSVNVFGSGQAEVYINGRKMRNASELDQLSSDNVKSVEVVRNPGARYDAAVQAVVRIAPTTATAGAC